jgi:hypothetical protein
MSQARRAWLLFVLAPVFDLHVRLGSGGRQAGVHLSSGLVAWTARWDGFVPIHPGRPGDRATVGEIAAARDKIAGLRSQNMATRP